jgi:hypothetical protein
MRLSLLPTPMTTLAWSIGRVMSGRRATISIALMPRHANVRTELYQRRWTPFLRWRCSPEIVIRRLLQSR